MSYLIEALHTQHSLGYRKSPSMVGRRYPTLFTLSSDGFAPRDDIAPRREVVLRLMTIY